MIRDFTKTMFQVGDRVTAVYIDRFGSRQEIDASIEQIKKDWIALYTFNSRDHVEVKRNRYISMYLHRPVERFYQELPLKMEE